MLGIYKEINNIAEDVIFDANMSEYTSFKAGGKADVLVTPKDTQELAGILRLLSSNNVPYYVMGNGSNILVKDGGYRGVIVRIGDAFSEVSIKGNEIEAGCGVLLVKLAKDALANSLTGLEFASGIPGSLGGAVYMNAGAYDGEMKQVLTSCKVLSAKDNFEIKEVPVQNMELGYRTSAFQGTGDVVISAKLILAEGNKDEINATMKDLAKRRNSKQPVNYPSAGSFFKRPTGYYAGKLVQDAGMKGASVGGAQVSELHSGFIINTGGATATDIVNLKNEVQAKVKSMFGVDLETEVRIIGED